MVRLGQLSKFAIIHTESDHVTVGDTKTVPLTDTNLGDDFPRI